MIHVGDRLDGLVDPLVDPQQIRHAVCDNTMSRGCVAPPRQSPGFSAQNSTQPIGERVVSPRLA